MQGEVQVLNCDLLAPHTDCTSTFDSVLPPAPDFPSLPMAVRESNSGVRDLGEDLARVVCGARARRCTSDVRADVMMWTTRRCTMRPPMCIVQRLHRPHRPIADRRSAYSGSCFFYPSWRAPNGVTARQGNGWGEGGDGDIGERRAPMWPLEGIFLGGGARG
jgi:hypothetical protein